MARTRRIDPYDGARAVDRWRRDGPDTDRETLATAVRHSLAVLAEQAPGHAVEVRVPPYGVVQCLPGPRHTRGTPPAVVETDPHTWLALVTGQLSWGEAVGTGRVHASGERADLAGSLPLRYREQA